MCNVCSIQPIHQLLIKSYLTLPYLGATGGTGPRGFQGNPGPRGPTGIEGPRGGPGSTGPPGKVDCPTSNLQNRTNILALKMPFSFA